MAEQVRLKHLEPVVARFELVLPGLCAQLKQHAKLILSCKKQGNVRALNREQIAASRSVKKVKKALKELDQLEATVVDHELQQFQQLVKPLKIMAYDELVRLVDLDNEIDEVSQFDIDEVPAFQAIPQTTSEHTLSNVERTREHTTRDDIDISFPQYGDDPREAPQSLQVQHQAQQVQNQVQAQQTELAVLEETAQSWNQLQSDIQEVAEIMQDFSKVLHEQADTLDTIEANVEQATERTRLGLLELVKARRAKIAGGTLTAAAVGAIVGGPIGMLAGFKVAGLITAALGGYMGYKSAGYINNTLHSDVEETPGGLEAPKPSAFGEGDDDEDLSGDFHTFGQLELKRAGVDDYRN